MAELLDDIADRWLEYKGVSAKINRQAEARKVAEKARILNEMVGLVGVALRTTRATKSKISSETGMSRSTLDNILKGKF
jgi:hypothetical protein